MHARRPHRDVLEHADSASGASKRQAETMHEVAEEGRPIDLGSAGAILAVRRTGFCFSLSRHAHAPPVSSGDLGENVCPPRLDRGPIHGQDRRRRCIRGRVQGNVSPIWGLNSFKCCMLLSTIDPSGLCACHFGFPCVNRRVPCRLTHPVDAVSALEGSDAPFRHPVGIKRLRPGVLKVGARDA